MQQDPTLHEEKWLNGAARLVQSRLVIVAGAAGMTLGTVTDRLRGSNYGFLIRVLHLLDELPNTANESHLPGF